MLALLLLLAVITLSVSALCVRLAKENDQLRAENTRLGGVTQYQQRELDRLDELANKGQRRQRLLENAIGEYVPAGAKLKLGARVRGRLRLRPRLHEDGSVFFEKPDWSEESHPNWPFIDTEADE